MMGRVRSSRPTSGGVEVAHRGVDRWLQLTLSARPDVRRKIHDPINSSILPTLSDGGGDEGRKRFKK